MPQYRFTLKCQFCGVEFPWPPMYRSIQAEGEGEALDAMVITCPGDPMKNLPPHVEIDEWRDTVEVLQTYEN